MDPDEALRKAREATDAIQRLLAEEPLTASDAEAALGAAEDLADAFGALDVWLSTQGFLPEAWRR